MIERIPKWKKEVIIKLHKEGLYQQIIAERLEISQKSVSNIINRWKKGDDNG